MTQIIKCPFCSEEIDSSVEICPFCAEKLTENKTIKRNSIQGAECSKNVKEYEPITIIAKAVFYIFAIIAIIFLVGTLF